jgi:hypothetical protein
MASLCASRARAIRQGKIESDDDEWIAFRVALTVPDRRSGDKNARG